MKNPEFKVNSKDALYLALIWKAPELLILAFVGLGMTFITTLFFSQTPFFNAEVRRFEEIKGSCVRRLDANDSYITSDRAHEVCRGVADRYMN